MFGKEVEQFERREIPYSKTMSIVKVVKMMPLTSKKVKKCFPT